MKFTALLIATVDAIKVMESAFDNVEHVNKEVHIGGIHDLATNSTMPHDEWIAIDMIVHHHGDEGSSHDSDSSNDSEWKHSSTGDWESTGTDDEESSGTDDWESSDERSADIETGEDGCEHVGYEENSVGRREWCEDVCVKAGGEWIVEE